jgi:hypothetical protein
VDRIVAICFCSFEQGTDTAIALYCIQLKRILSRSARWPSRYKSLSEKKSKKIKIIISL